MALRWLIANNPLYKEVEVDLNALSSLPEDGNPTQVYESIMFCDKVVEDMMSRSHYDQEDDEEADEYEGPPLPLHTLSQLLVIHKHGLKLLQRTPINHWRRCRMSS
jgi:hypothetical protein